MEETRASPLEEILGEIQNHARIHKNVPLSKHSQWRVGGAANIIIEPDSADSVQPIIHIFHKHRLRYLILGSTSNLLFDDDGLQCPAILIGRNLNRITVEGTQVCAEAGVWVPRFAKKVADHGLSGAEHTAGIPGTLGGLICMNGGSQRKGISDHLTEVTYLSSNGDLQTKRKDECNFSYRQSSFQNTGDIILSAKFEFQNTANPSQIKKEMLGILSSRRKKFPRKLPNCGSVFVSNPAMYEEIGPPGAAIEGCGLKGTTKGGAQISPLHANFIVNNGNATASDILYLIHLIRTTVLQKTGYEMPTEVRYVSKNGEISPAHVEAASRAASATQGV
ncbi:UDP-N-acetylmuramate dehydrogenase [Pelagicoccus sp. SDUM812005]|uniref:UDP-N-acetylmuramate dehydrogenase n=1 Tax=Pelagicoccus sp. SDUM812005 TaxID=3041257 RepID=UPI00280CE66B|nr:UDP-N-acetylmuramate dehydrogenase [Pelagicoccus sp. SDUM812005]MDQ8183731.1 UDP-N-acetylmuramate dehydrogenase [Pelagicoccus sp. SDUM812005]